MEESQISEHQGLYSRKVGATAPPLMPRGSKRRSGHQSSPGRKEISLDGEEMALAKALEARLIGSGGFGRGSTSVFYEDAQGYS